jgi:hypothetical protein
MIQRDVCCREVEWEDHEIFELPPDILFKKSPFVKWWEKWLLLPFLRTKTGGEEGWTVNYKMWRGRFYLLEVKRRD